MGKLSDYSLFIVLIAVIILNGCRKREIDAYIDNPWQNYAWKADPFPGSVYYPSGMYDDVVIFRVSDLGSYSSTGKVIGLSIQDGVMRWEYQGHHLWHHMNVLVFYEHDNQILKGLDMNTGTVLWTRDGFKWNISCRQDGRYVYYIDDAGLPENTVRCFYRKDILTGTDELIYRFSADSFSSLGEIANENSTVADVLFIQELGKTYLAISVDGDNDFMTLLNLTSGEYLWVTPLPEEYIRPASFTLYSQGRLYMSAVTHISFRHSDSYKGFRLSFATGALTQWSDNPYPVSKMVRYKNVHLVPFHSGSSYYCYIYDHNMKLLWENNPAPSDASCSVLDDLVFTGSPPGAAFDLYTGELRIKSFPVFCCRAKWFGHCYAIPASQGRWEARVIYTDGQNLDYDYENGIDTSGLDGIVCYNINR